MFCHEAGSNLFDRRHHRKNRRLNFYWLLNISLLFAMFFLLINATIMHCFYQGNQCNPTSTSNFLPWPSPSDLNTRLRRIVAGFQRILKKEELKRVAVEKVGDWVLNELISLHGCPCRNTKTKDFF